MTVRYMQGFGNEFATEALEGALPDGQNSPQRCPYGLYAEHFSGTAFTAPRAANRRSWLYRIRPSVVHPPFRRFSNGSMTNDFTGQEATPNQLRWSPVPIPAEPKDGVLQVGVRQHGLRPDHAAARGHDARGAFPAVALLDEDAMHDRDLPGRPAERERGDPRPHLRRLAQRHRCGPHALTPRCWCEVQSCFSSRASRAQR